MPETSYTKYVAISVIIIAIFAVVYYNLRQEQPAPAEEIHSPYKIAFSGIQSNNEDIYIVDTEKNLQRITTEPSSEFSPSWSPDRTKIAFASTKDDPKGDIYIMNADGTDWTRLTNASSIDIYPVWSPNGKKIAFLSSRWNTSASGPTPDKYRLELYTMNVDGTNQVRRTGTNGAVYSDLQIRWLSNDEIIFAYRSAWNNVTAVTLDDNNRAKNVSIPNVAGYPIYSPDKKKILFRALLNDVSDLFATNADGSGLLRLTDHEKAELNADWSPDGKAIVFVREGKRLTANNTYTSVWDVLVIGADGCCFKYLVSGHMSIWHAPAWAK